MSLITKNSKSNSRSGLWLWLMAGGAAIFGVSWWCVPWLRPQLGITKPPINREVGVSAEFFSLPVLGTNDALAGKKSGLMPFKGSLRVEDMSAEQRRKLAQMFTNEFKPALARWSGAYKGHAPFREEDVKLEQFKHRLGNDTGNGIYTFVLDNGATLDFAETGGSARVFYLMSATGAKALNSIASSGMAPNLSVPITREEVVQMALADTGKQFLPNQILIRPTGAACSLQGGAFVSVGGNANQWDLTNVSFVIGPDGMLVNYEAPAY